MSFGRVRAQDQLIFLNTGRIWGIQDYSIDNNFGDYSVNYLGRGSRVINETVDSIQYCDVSFNSYLIDSDFFVQQTGEAPIDIFILKNQSDNNPYSLISGYLNSYNIKYEPNQIPISNTSFRFYNQCGNINTGSLDANSSSLLAVIYSNTYSFDGNIANTNYINLSINEYLTNRVTNFSLGININRIPIFQVGNRYPSKVNTIYPLNFSCDLTFEADPSFIDTSLNDFPVNRTVQNIEVDIFSHLSNNPMTQYKFYNATLISSKSQMNVDGNLTYSRRYIGQIFNTTNV